MEGMRLAVTFARLGPQSNPEFDFFENARARTLEPPASVTCGCRASDRALLGRRLGQSEALLVKRELLVEFRPVVRVAILRNGQLLGCDGLRFLASGIKGARVHLQRV